MTLAHRAVRGTAILLVSSYGNLAIGFVTTTVLMRLLSNEVFGLFALSTFFYSVLDPRNKLGLDYALIHRQPNSDDAAATHWILQLSLACVALLFGLIASWFLPLLGYSRAVAPLLIALCVIGIIEAAGSTARVLLEKELRLGRSSAIISSAMLIANVSAIALAWLGVGVWSLVAQVGVNALLASIGFWLITPVKPRFAFSPAVARWMLRFGSSLAIGSVASIILLQGDNYLVATFVNVAVAGYYVQAYKIAQWPTGLVTHVVSRAALSTYAKLQDDQPRLSKAFDLTLWVIISAATPLALALFVSAPDFILLFFGEKWLPSAGLLRFLVGYSVLRPLLDDTGALLVAVGRPQRLTQLLLVQAGALVVFALPLTRAYGATGTAIGVGLTFIVGVAVAYHFVAEYVTLNWRAIFAPPIIATVVTLGLYAGLIQVYDLNVLPLLARVIFKGAFAALLFGLTLLIIQRETTERLRYVWRLLRGQ